MTKLRFARLGSMNRRLSLLMLMIVVEFWSGSLAVAQQAIELDRESTDTDAPRRPNIVFLLSDDHRSDHMSCAGHEILQTPNFDRLAEDGVRFENMFVTTSICAASRATLLTGLYERSHRYTFRTVPLSIETTRLSYPRLLRDAGYRTGFVGKFGVGVQSGETQAMFDTFVPLNRSPYLKPQADGSERHVTQICADRAIEFLNDQNGEQPFCLSISFNAPHAEDSDKQDHYPWPLAVDGLYEGVEVPLPELSADEIFDAHPDFLKASLNRQRYFWRWDTPEKYQRNMLAYYRLLTGVDHAVGRVLDRLDELDLADNTVVIFAGDNGYYMGSRGFAGKWSHYEESLRVPLIIRDPRQASTHRNVVQSQMVLNVDLAPTILAIAGVQVPATYQGADLTPLLSGQTPERWRTDFLIEHLMHHDGLPKYEGIRDQRWVYARYFEQEPVYEYLHDLESDPQQLVNLADDPEYRDELERWRQRCDDVRDEYGGAYSLEKFPLAR